MLICAAVKFQIEGLDHETIIPCLRHCDAFDIIKDLGYAPKSKYREIEQGFIDNKGKFYNRYEAFLYAREIGQISQTTVQFQEDGGMRQLYSEDLY